MVYKAIVLAMGCNDVTLNLETSLAAEIGLKKKISFLLSTKAEIKIVQLDLSGVAMVFFSFISFLQICFSRFTFPSTCIDKLASKLMGFLAWLECLVWV